MNFAVDMMKADDFLIIYSLLVNYLPGIYLRSELSLQDLFLLEARQVTRLVGSFGGPIWEETRYENVEIDSLRVTAIPNRCIQDLFYCPSKHKFINFHQNKPQYKLFQRFCPVLMHPFLSLIISSLLVLTSSFSDHNNYKIDIIDFEPKKTT